MGLTQRKCFKFSGNLPALSDPRIFLGGQAGELLSSVPKVFPDALVQNCDRHAVEATKERFKSNGYRKPEISEEFENGERGEHGAGWICPVVY